MMVPWRVGPSMFESWLRPDLTATSSKEAGSDTPAGICDETNNLNS
jgi:hypothetical protein